MQPTVLIVDDNAVLRMSIAAVLEDFFRIVDVDSGEAALALLQTRPEPMPDLVLLDIEMHQLDGYETCQAMRSAGYAMPVIFVSSHDTLNERLRAFDAGGDDFISKPYDAAELERKAQLAVQRKLHAEGLQQATQQILHEVGETGVLLSFLREAIRVTDYAALALLLFKSVGDYGVRCYVQLRHEHGVETLAPSDTPTQLELSILERATALDHRFRLGRRLVINYHFISLLIVDMPDDVDRARRLSDYLDVLVESAEAVAETIDVRRESALRAEALMVATGGSVGAIETLRERYRKQQADTHVLLQELIEEVEHTYVHLGLTESQEETISSALRRNAERILHLFAQSVEFEQQFAAVLDALKPQSNVNADVWL
jgi:DNA-binding response OmpR family regulator